MSKQVCVRVPDEEYQALQRLIAAHDEWLAAAAKFDPAYQTGLDEWSMSDAVNAALLDFCERATGEFEKSRKLLQKGQARR